MKIVVFLFKFHLNVKPMVQLIKYIIGSNNGLVPKSLHAIIWFCGGLVYWRINAFLGLDELRELVHNTIIHLLVYRTLFIEEFYPKWA